MANNISVCLTPPRRPPPSRRWTSSRTASVRRERRPTGSAQSSWPSSCWPTPATASTRTPRWFSRAPCNGWPPNNDKGTNHQRRRVPAPEGQMLGVLARNPGKLVSQRPLLQAVWGPSYLTQTHYLAPVHKPTAPQARAGPHPPTAPHHRAGHGLPVPGL